MALYLNFYFNIICIKYFKIANHIEFIIIFNLFIILESILNLINEKYNNENVCIIAIIFL